jgi:hypothetical protein
MSWKIGDTSKKYEVGDGGPGTISTGNGDYGGISYGTYQFSSKMGTVARFVSAMGYSNYFNGTEPGTPEFSALWIKLAKEEGTFGDAQHEFIKKNYFDVQMNFLKIYRFNFEDRGPAILDLIWSTSVQFGPRTSLIRKALNTLHPDDMLDSEIVAAVQWYKIANNDKLFRSSSKKIRAGTLRRATNEKRDLMDLAITHPSKVAIPITKNRLDNQPKTVNVVVPIDQIEEIQPIKTINKVTWYRSLLNILFG